MASSTGRPNLRGPARGLRPPGLPFYSSILIIKRRDASSVRLQTRGTRSILILHPVPPFSHSTARVCYLPADAAAATPQSAQEAPSAIAEALSPPIHHSAA